MVCLNAGLRCEVGARQQHAQPENLTPILENVEKLLQSPTFCHSRESGNPDPDTPIGMPTVVSANRFKPGSPPEFTPMHIGAGMTIKGFFYSLILMYDIVAVTVNYKMKEKVLAMLRSFFLDINGSSLSVQAVVVDNASGDGIGPAIAAEFPQVRCIENSRNIGFGAANNLALEMFDARYFFLVNPDIVFPAGGLAAQKFFAFMEEYPKIGLAAPKLILDNGAVQYSCLHFPGFLDHPLYRLGVHEKYSWANRRVERLLMTNFNREKTLPVDWATGAALFLRAKVLAQVGFFDKRFFMYYEDCDLCRRFWQAGWPVYYKGDIVLSHGYERASAKVPGFKSLWQNRLTRTHLESLVKYWWKWRVER